MHQFDGWSPRDIATGQHGIGHAWARSVFCPWCGIDLLMNPGAVLKELPFSLAAAASVPTANKMLVHCDCGNVLCFTLPLDSVQVWEKPGRP